MNFKTKTKSRKIKQFEENLGMLVRELPHSNTEEIIESLKILIPMYKFLIIERNKI